MPHHLRFTALSLHTRSRGRRPSSLSLHRMHPSQVDHTRTDVACSDGWVTQGTRLAPANRPMITGLKYLSNSRPWRLCVPALPACFPLPPGADRHCASTVHAAGLYLPPPNVDGFD